MLFAEIVTIGDEILIGQIIDTNAAFLGKELNKIGVDVCQVTSIRDQKQHILETLDQACLRADIILVTGGLGPTKDDITKAVICEYFDTTLVQNDEVLRHIEKLFKKYDIGPLSELNRQQALVPDKSTVLMNHFGTAPGMWLQKEDKVFVFMPGVPHEMKGLMNNEVLPRLQKKYKRPHIIHKTIRTYGIGESALAQKIEDWENSLPTYLKLAYLPNLGHVRLRLSARGYDKKVLDNAIEDNVSILNQTIGQYIVGYEDEENIESKIALILMRQNKTLSVAESCTGGKIAASITQYAGASGYFKGGVVTYATQSKIDVLNIDPDIIKKHTVTSKEVVEAMALGVKNKFDSDYAIATTGNAGPDKGDGDVEVGTVFIAIATPNGIFSDRFVMGNDRTRTLGKTVTRSFELLYNKLV